jgi:hypothetical protein
METRTNKSLLHPRSSALICGLILCGCSGYTGPRSVVNDDPAVKIPQIRKAVDANDRSVQPYLFDDLNDDDAAVRFYAIEALARLNGGERLGYDWKVADRHERTQWIEAWRVKLNLPPTTAPTTEPTAEAQP